MTTHFYAEPITEDLNGLTSESNVCKLDGCDIKVEKIVYDVYKISNLTLWKNSVLSLYF